MIRRSSFILSLFCIASLLLFMAACGGSSSSHTTASNLSITTSSMSAGTVGAAYAATMQATGGTPPYKWSLKSGTLPAGVSLSTAGALSGTPTAAGTANALVFAVTDADQNSATSNSLSLLVNPEAPPQVQTSLLQNGNVGVAYSATLTATGGTKPYSWSLKSGSLPAGLSLDSATGAITGTPTQSGSFPLVFDVTDLYNAAGASGNLNVTIDPVIQVSTTSLPSGTQGAAYTGNLTATGGSGVYTWSLKSGSLPPGLSLNSSTGAITGTPTKANIFAGLVFEATDADTATGVSAPLSLQVYNTLGCSSGAETTLGTQPHAFLIKGFDPSSTVLAPTTVIGSFTPDAQGGVTAGEIDINSPSGAQSALSIIPASSSYTLGPDNNGCLVLATSAGVMNFHFSVSTPNNSAEFTQGHIMLDDGSGTGARGTGILRLQDSSAIAAGLTGMYAFSFAGTDGTSGHFAVVGSFNAAGGSVSNLALDSNDAGTLTTGVTGGTGAYSSTDAYGRGTASLTATGFSLNSVYYVVSSSEALFASSDPLATNPISSGRALATDSTSFSAAYLSSNYIAHAAGLPSIDAPEVVIAALNFDAVSSGNGSIIQDAGGTVSNWSVSVNYTVDATTGRVFFTGNFTTPVGYLVTSFTGVSAVLLGNDGSATSGTLEAQASAQPQSGLYSMGTDENLDYLTANQVGTLNLGSSIFSGTQNLSNAASPFLVENQAVSNSFSFGTTGTGMFWGSDAVSSGSAIYFINEQGGTNTHPAIISVTK